MARSFSELLRALSDEAEPLEAIQFSALSDLDAQRLSLFQPTWEGMASDRRLLILRMLGDLADAKIELSFEPINRLALQDGDPRIRAQAIQNLWESEDPQFARQLMEALQSDPADEVRRTAALGLGAFVLLAETQDLEAALQSAIEQTLLTAVESDRSFTVRECCLQSLGYSTRSEVPALIERAYASEEPSRRLAALRAMAHSADSSWGPKVMVRLHDPEPDMRLEAVQAAGELDLQQAAAELVDLLDDVDDRVRRAAIWSLGQIGGPTAAAALERLQRNPSKAEAQLIQDALDNLAFQDGVREIFMLDFDHEDPAE